jgi:phosphonate transport system substrate-binding protein
MKHPPGKLWRWLGCVTLGLASSMACAQSDPPAYSFSPVNQYGIATTAAYWNPILAHVSEKSGVKLSLKIGRTSADTTSYVLAKEVEFVFTNHLFSPEREKLGWKVFGRRNTPPLRGQIVVPADSPITELAQLNGKDVAFSGPEAFVIYKVPYSHLLSKGLAVKVVFAGNADASLAQLSSGKVSAAGGNSQLVEGYTKRENKNFRVLWSSEPYNDLALMASGKVPEKDLKAVANAFINMANDAQGRVVLERVSKEVGLPSDAVFIAATGADYASYRRFFQSAPSELH